MGEVGGWVESRAAFSFPLNRNKTSHGSKLYIFHTKDEGDGEVSSATEEQTDRPTQFPVYLIRQTNTVFPVYHTRHRFPEYCSRQTNIVLPVHC